MTAPLRLQWRGNPDGTERVIDGVMLGWVIDTEFGMSAQMMEVAVQFCMSVQRERLRGMASGPQRDALAHAVTLLAKGRVRQNIAGPGERVMLDAYKKGDGDAPIWSFPN